MSTEGGISQPILFSITTTCHLSIGGQLTNRITVTSNIYINRFNRRVSVICILLLRYPLHLKTHRYQNAADALQQTHERIPVITLWLVDATSNSIHTMFILLTSFYILFAASPLTQAGGGGQTASRERFKRSARINHRDANDDNKRRRRRREEKKEKKSCHFPSAASRNEHQCAFKLSADESVRSNPFTETKSALCTALTFDRVEKKNF